MVVPLFDELCISRAIPKCTGEEVYSTQPVFYLLRWPISFESLKSGIYINNEISASRYVTVLAKTSTYVKIDQEFYRSWINKNKRTAHSDRSKFVDTNLERSINNSHFNFLRSF